jgi:hypothetical protein
MKERLDSIKERLDSKQEWLNSAQESLDSMEKRLDSKQERMRSFQCHLTFLFYISYTTSNKLSPVLLLSPAINYRYSFVVTGNKLSPVSWAPVINLSLIYTTRGINEKPCQNMFTDVMDTCEKFIASIFDTSLYRKPDLCIRRNEAARPHFNSRQTSICEPFIYVFLGSVCLFGCSKIGWPILGIYKLLTDT